MQPGFFLATLLALSTVACVRSNDPGVDADSDAGPSTTGGPTFGHSTGVGFNPATGGGVVQVPGTTRGFDGGLTGFVPMEGDDGGNDNRLPADGRATPMECDPRILDLLDLCCPPGGGRCVDLNGGTTGGGGLATSTSGISGGGLTGLLGGDGGVFGGGSVEITDEPWDPPVELEPASSKPAWRDSSEPLCTEQQGFLGSHAVWSDSRGVFALVSSAVGGFGGGPLVPELPCADCPGLTLWFNDGQGWEPYFEPENGTAPSFLRELKLAGVPGGPLFAYGQGDFFDGSSCGLSTITAEGRTCEPVRNVDSLFVVHADLTYAVSQGSLLEYRDGSWGPSPGMLSDTPSLAQVWADESAVFATTHSAGQLLERVGDGWTVLDTRTLQQWTSLWGHSATDLYVGSDQGRLYHYDGAQLQEIPWDHQACEVFGTSIDVRAVGGIWGADGVTYFHTGHQLGRVVDGTTEVIAEWPCDAPGQGPLITSIWGNGPDELFVALSDMRTPRQQCGTAFLLYYDGEAFHRL